MIEKRIEILEQQMDLMKKGLRRIEDRMVNLDTTVSPGGWVSEAFDRLETELDELDRKVELRFASIEEKLKKIDKRFDEQRELIGKLFERLQEISEKLDN
jgi:chromosome segregation ATPase